jgi:protein-S-isoprenylcysteine O-methyltransferase Ste14
VPPIVFEYVIWAHPNFFHGFGNFSTLSPLTVYPGCLFIASGITLRLLAVAALKNQFTLKVTIVENHTVVDTGIYRIIRHPSYLGHLVSLFGIGLILGNWVGLTALVVLPLTAILYRIHVEEAALVEYFGPVYQAYSSRTKRLLPGIW